MERDVLFRMYVEEELSAQEIADSMGFSRHKIGYWLRKYEIPVRLRRDAMYAKYNHGKTPFQITPLSTRRKQLLYGLGIGIYWGEGNKRNPTSVRVGNTDALLVRTFVLFLVEVCGVSPAAIRYGLQLFSDVSEAEALSFWQNELNITRKQIMPTVNRIKSGKIGTYKVKNQFGVMTVYVHNRKLRDWMVSQLFVPR